MNLRTIAMTGVTAPFMVMDTDILSSGIWSKRIFMSSTESMATPAMPTSPLTRGLSESYLQQDHSERILNANRVSFFGLTLCVSPDQKPR